MLHRIHRLIGIAVLALACVPAVSRAGAQVGQPAPPFSANNLSGQTRSLAEFQGKIVVLEWNNPGCPFVQKHYNSGNMQRLQREFTSRGVVWLTINSTNQRSPDFLPAPQQMSWLQSSRFVATDYLRDPDGTVGRLYGARTTPHMFVINRQGVLVYAGGIDDRGTTDVADIAGAHNFVSDALDEVLAGEPVKVASAPPYGCSVKY